jgi:hypothetical protein
MGGTPHCKPLGNGFVCACVDNSGDRGSGITIKVELVIKWFSCDLFCPFSIHLQGTIDNLVFLGLLDLSIVKNPHAHCAILENHAHFCYGTCTCGVQAIVPTFAVLPEILTHLARLAQNSLKAPFPGTMTCTQHFP